MQKNPTAGSREDKNTDSAMQGWSMSIVRLHDSSLGEISSTESKSSLEEFTIRKVTRAGKHFGGYEAAEVRNLTVEREV